MSPGTGSLTHSKQISKEMRCYHNGRRLALLNKEGCNKSPPERKEGGAIMMMDYITFAGFILAVFVTGVAVGKLVEKIERLAHKKEDEEHNNTSKNDHR